MRSRTLFHADQAARNVGEPALKLSARAFELPNNRPALIETDKMEAILTEIDADRADGIRIHPAIWDRGNGSQNNAPGRSAASPTGGYARRDATCRGCCRTRRRP